MSDNNKNQYNPLALIISLGVLLGICFINAVLRAGSPVSILLFGSGAAFIGLAIILIIIKIRSNKQ